jgi:hypothetical protein
VTVLNSRSWALAALLHGVDQVVFSNERSASTVADRGHGEVNHQWSKGWTCEKAFGEYLQRPLRPTCTTTRCCVRSANWPVARQFARTDTTTRTSAVATSTSTSSANVPPTAGAAVCPKCHFVFLALLRSCRSRAWSHLRSQPARRSRQTDGYDALLEYQNHKPFECVGEVANRARPWRR